MAGNTQKRPFRSVHVAGGREDLHGARSQHEVSVAAGGVCPELVEFGYGCGYLGPTVRIDESLVRWRGWETWW